MAREMKDSGVEWIGEIPANWKIPTVRYLYNIGRGRVIAQTELEEDGVYPVYSSQTKNNGCLGYINTYDFDVNQLTWTTDGANAGTVFLREGKHNCTNVCGTLQPKIENIYLKYQKYALEHIAFYHKRADINGFKIMNNEMAAIHTLLPSFIEQQKIADFLDKKCTAIDSAITKTTESIGEYKKLKQAIITKAVTKGIRGDRPMKNSENIWFGDVPEHWEVKKLKYHFSIKKDIAGKDGLTVLSITQRGIIPKDITKNEGQLADNYSKYQIVSKGDFAMNHMDLLTGWVDISNYDGVTSPDYRVFILKDKFNNCSKYFLYMMQMCYFNRIFFGLGQGVSNLGRWRLQADKFLTFSIPIPTLEEQQEIADYLDKKCTGIDKIITKKEQLITDLESYKKSLIYEYVTGKKEVLP